MSKEVLPTISLTIDRLSDVDIASTILTPSLILTDPEFDEQSQQRVLYLCDYCKVIHFYKSVLICIILIKIN